MRENHLTSRVFRGDLRRGAGFIDAHLHVKDACCLGALVDIGIVAVRDAGMRDTIRNGVNSIARDNGLPRIISAGWALYKKGGYGSLFGKPVESREEIKSAILALKKAGAGIIKIMSSGMVSLKEPGRVTAGGFKRDELQFIVQEAAACGLGVMAHASGEQVVIDAAEAGVRSIEHGFFMSKRALEVMAKRSTFWVPTVGALRRAARSSALSKETEDFVAGLISSHLEMILHAHGVGVPLAVGTDCVLPDPHYAEAYEAELAYYEQAGIPHDVVIKIAVEGGARLLGL